jgi:hypothetical protein
MARASSDGLSGVDARLLVVDVEHARPLETGVVEVADDVAVVVAGAEVARRCGVGGHHPVHQLADGVLAADVAHAVGDGADVLGLDVRHAVGGAADGGRELLVLDRHLAVDDEALLDGHVEGAHEVRRHLVAQHRGERPVGAVGEALDDAEGRDPVDRVLVHRSVVVAEGVTVGRRREAAVQFAVVEPVEGARHERRHLPTGDRVERAEPATSTSLDDPERRERVDVVLVHRSVVVAEGIVAGREVVVDRELEETGDERRHLPALDRQTWPVPRAAGQALGQAEVGEAADVRLVRGSGDVGERRGRGTGTGEVGTSYGDGRFLRGGADRCDGERERSRGDQADRAPERPRAAVATGHVVLLVCDAGGPRGVRRARCRQP